MKLPTRLIVDASQGIAERFSAAMEKDTKLTLNFQDVEVVDTAGLQLLLCMSRTLTEQGREVVWKAVPEEFYASARLLGMSELLEVG